MSSPFEVAMMQEVSVAEAKSRLTSLLHEVEAGAPVQITRRGKAVAVLLSEAEYAALKAREPTRGLWETISRWRAETVPDWPDLGPEEVDAWRDRTPAKDFDWPE
jgi:prevent-host-death family protein